MHIQYADIGKAAVDTIDGKDILIFYDFTQGVKTSVLFKVQNLRNLQSNME